MIIKLAFPDPGHFLFDMAPSQKHIFQRVRAVHLSLAITHALQQCCTCRGARYARLDSSGPAQDDTTTIRHAMDVLGDLQHPR